MQSSDAVSTLISPALSDTTTASPGTIDLGSSKTFNAVGIGYTDATTVTVDGEAITVTNPTPYPGSYRNGLYALTSSHTGQNITISHNGTYIGRIALGLSRTIGCAPAREPGLWTTATSRTTLSGQVISGAGGVSGRIITVDARYKIDDDIFSDFELAYAGQISKNYPFFILFDDESSRFPWTRLYATIDKIESFILQSSVNRFLYSRKFTLKEAF